MAAITKATKAKPTLVPTGMKCKLEPDTYLELSVRSSCPLKHWLILANSVGIIDADYYNNEDNMEKLNFCLFPARSKYMDLEKQDQRDFKSVLQAFLRSYSFIAQVERMMDKEMQQNYIYCKYLNKVLPKNANYYSA
jgi:dUTPase